MNGQLIEYYIKTFGCTFNQSDTEKIEFILNNTNYINTLEISKADIIIINTCAVKQQTENKILDYLKQIRNQYKQKLIIVAGCLPQIEEKIKKEILLILGNFGFILKPNELAMILHKIELYRNPNMKIENCNIITDKAKLTPSIHTDSITGIIQISEGCNSNCTYCCTKNARGKLVSFNPDLIINQVIYYLKNGKKEIYLTSQDLGIYDYDGIKLHDLLERLINLDYVFKIRLGMMNPIYLKKNTEQLIKLFQNQKLYRFLHLPIQSGSREILKKMGRNLDFDIFFQNIEEIRKFDPKFSFSTDIIVGFPTETEEDFNLTKNIIERWKPDVINISKYTNRPNTAAKNMPQVPSQFIKNRSKILGEIYQEYIHEINKSWIGWEGEILINERNTNSEYSYTGRSLYYKPILTSEGPIGSIKKYKIIKPSGNSLIGQII